MQSGGGGGPGVALSCGLVLVFAVLLQTICVAITFLYFTNELQQLRSTYSESNMACFTRENFFLEDLDPYYSEDSDPCWQVKRQLSRLIKKMMARHRANEASSSGASSAIDPTATETRGAFQSVIPRVAAHLTANPNRKSALTTQNIALGSNLGYKINTWESSRRGNSFCYNVDVRNGELVIRQTGFYYIYSQIYFRFREPEGVEPDSDPGSDSVRNPKQMVQYISKFTDYPDPILLMKSARTSCWSKNAEYGLYSIYQGGVFHLKNNDRIFVSVSSKDLVDMDRETSFFGAFLVL
ncbi:tumor necrosis factor ligand superfamily member 10 isoform X1 [Pogona vitticeps]